jgi:hypothetical protein
VSLCIPGTRAADPPDGKQTVDPLDQGLCVGVKLQGLPSTSVLEGTGSSPPESVSTDFRKTSSMYSDILSFYYCLLLVTTVSKLIFTICIFAPVFSSGFSTRVQDSDCTQSDQVKLANSCKRLQLNFSNNAFS